MRYENESDINFKVHTQVFIDFQIKYYTFNSNFTLGAHLFSLAFGNACLINVYSHTYSITEVPIYMYTEKENEAKI